MTAPMQPAEVVQGEEIPMRKCTHCDGTGDDPNEHITEKCHLCKGLGFRDVPTSPSPAEVAAIRERAKRLTANSWDTYIPSPEKRDWMSIADTILFDGRAVAHAHLASCDTIETERATIAAKDERIADLEAKIERLTNRGIEDMKHRIAELESDLARLTAEHAKCPVPVFNADCTVNELGKAIIAEQREGATK